MVKGSRLSQFVNWFTSRKHFRGVIDCPASIPQICQGNVSKKLFTLKSSLKNEEMQNLLRRLRNESQCLSHGLTDKWFNFAKEQKLFGIQQPSEYGGLRLDDLQTACVFEELCFNIPLAMLLMSHNYWVLDTLTKCSLPDGVIRKLCSGEILGALACTEQRSGTDFQGQESTFVNDRFSGTKHWVTGADKASLFLVSGYDGGGKFRLAVVEEGFSVRPLNVIGSDGLNFCDVLFENAPVLAYAKIDDTYSSLISTMLNGRKFVTAICSGLAKHLLNEIISFLRLDESNLTDRTSADNERIWLKASSLALSCESLAFYMCLVDWDSEGIEVALASCRAIDICRELIQMLANLLDMRIVVKEESILPILMSQIELLSHFGWSELVVRLYSGNEIIRQLGRDRSDEFKKLLNENTGLSQKMYMSSEKDCLLRGLPVFLYDIWEHSKAPWVNSHKAETCLVQLKSACYHIMLRDRVGILDEGSENQQPDLIKIGRLSEHALTLLALQARLHIGQRQQTLSILDHLTDKAMENEVADATKLYRELCGHEFPQSEVASRIGRQMLTEGRYPLSSPIKRLF